MTNGISHYDCVCLYFYFFSFIFQESLAEARVGGGLLHGQDHWVQQCMHGTCWRRCHYLHYLHHSLASGEITGRKQPHPSTENCIKDVLSMAPPIRTRPIFLHSQSLPLGSFHKPLIFIHQREDNENHNHRKLTKLITWTTALSPSSRESSQPRDQTQFSGIADGFFTVWATREAPPCHSAHPQSLG